MNTNINGVRPRRRYETAFKRDAVNRVMRTGKTCKAVAEELGFARAGFYRTPDAGTLPPRSQRQQRVAHQRRPSQLNRKSKIALQPLPFPSIASISARSFARPVARLFFM